MRLSFASRTSRIRFSETAFDNVVNDSSDLDRPDRRRGALMHAVDWSRDFRPLLRMNSNAGRHDAGSETVGVHLKPKLLLSQPISFL